MSRFFIGSAIASCLAFATACTGGEESVNAPIADHVVFIGLDGFAGNTFEKADMPNLRQLMADGCFTLEKRAMLPSSSAPNWASLFMGAGPESHGYTWWGAKEPEMASIDLGKNNIFPTIFQLYRDSNPAAEMGVLSEWETIKYLVDSLSCNYYGHAGNSDSIPDQLCQMTVDYIKSKKPNLMAVIFDNPDHVGHSIGWDTPEYYEKLQEMDVYIGRIMDAAKEAGIADETIFIVTSDHGGVNKGHGKATLAEVETPFIISGKGIRSGMAIEEKVLNIDVAPTLAHIFAIDSVPPLWRGRAIMSIFE